MKGKVYLVGAGPSDPGLMTIKGKTVLEKADVVVHDALVGDGILMMIPEEAERINVGKRAGNHRMKQEEISRLLASLAKQGKQVVRLKGGDPFLFGRGGEEIEVLVQEGISFEVVPGVSSAMAVPAYQGIPVTHRDYCSSVHLITGHQRADGNGGAIDYEALVRTGGTLVFFMGVAALSGICRGLLAAGMDPDCPAALLSRGTEAGQRKILASVSTLEEEVRRQGPVTPALIVVGEVCGLSDQFAWYEKMPLGGVRVLLTRPKELISETAGKLRELGADVIELPVICTEVIQENPLLDSALERIRTFDWLVLTSPAGVRIFFEELLKRNVDARSLAHLKIAVMGKGSAKALKERGFLADLIPDYFDGDHLGQALAAHCGADTRVLIPRARAGGQELIEHLIRSGAEVEDVPTYDTVYRTDFPVDVASLLSEGNVDCCLFTSSSTVKAFVETVGGADLSALRAVCIGKKTADTAEAAGMQTEVSEEASIDSLLEKLQELYTK